MLDLLEHLVGLQAQEPQEPHVGVWSRLRNFAPAYLSGSLVRREAVRILLTRRTLHLVSARDCLRLRRLHDPMLSPECAARWAAACPASTRKNSPRPVGCCSLPR